MSDAISAHGTLIAREVTTAGVFVVIGELGGDITAPPFNRASTEVTPHNDNIDGYVMGVLRRGEATFPINFLPSHATKGHDAVSGLQFALIENRFDGYQLTYPDGSEWIFSAFVMNIGPTAPAREGALTADVTVRPSGPHQIDGVIIVPQNQKTLPA